ncbi:hypothetical protein B484DRAFT_204640 [Ochromonadaceae sp. CCMP2298]|nr:hypothetical protein B484DRAFT_204640 [Ochromonadaceae sp. CCMP2298]
MCCSACVQMERYACMVCGCVGVMVCWCVGLLYTVRLTLIRVGGDRSTPSAPVPPYPRTPVSYARLSVKRTGLRTIQSTAPAPLTPSLHPTAYTQTSTNDSVMGTDRWKVTLCLSVSPTHHPTVFRSTPFKVTDLGSAMPTSPITTIVCRLGV